jgi:hypothetical protein
MVRVAAAIQAIGLFKVLNSTTTFRCRSHEEQLQGLCCLMQQRRPTVFLAAVRGRLVSMPISEHVC